MKVETGLQVAVLKSDTVQVLQGYGPVTEPQEFWLAGTWGDHEVPPHHQVRAVVSTVSHQALAN